MNGSEKLKLAEYKFKVFKDFYEEQETIFKFIKLFNEYSTTDEIMVELALVFSFIRESNLEDEFKNYSEYILSCLVSDIINKEMLN